MLDPVFGRGAVLAWVFTGVIASVPLPASLAAGASPAGLQDGGTPDGGSPAAIEFNDSVIACDFTRMTNPVKLEGCGPRYTWAAREAHVQGIIRVKCVVTEAGRLESCKFIQSLPYMEKSVLAALETWRFTPATYDGRPIAVSYVINIRLFAPREDDR